MAKKKLLVIKDKSTPRKAGKKASGKLVIHRPKLLDMVPGNGLEMLPQDGVDTALGILRAANANAGNPSTFQSLNDIRPVYLPMPQIAEQYMLGCKGIQLNTITEIVGPAKAGKTTLVLTWCGHWMKNYGTPCVFIDPENKMPGPERLMRIMDFDPRTAAELSKRLIYRTAFSVSEIWQEMQNAVDVLRGRKNTRDNQVCIPLERPIVIVVDGFGKAMALRDSYEFYDYDDNQHAENKKKAQAPTEGSNMEFAKWMHSFCTRAPAFMAQNNVTIIVVSHQNDKVDMAGSFVPSFMKGADGGAMTNAVKRGGRAIEQTAALQMVIGRGEPVKNSQKVTIGYQVKVRIRRASYAPEGREMSMDMIGEYPLDTQSYLTPPLQYASRFLTRLVEDGNPLTITLGDEPGTYSCSSLGLANVAPEYLVALFQSNPKYWSEVGKMLGIRGYQSYEEFLAALPTAAPVQAAPQPQLEG